MKHQKDPQLKSQLVIDSNQQNNYPLILCKKTQQSDHVCFNQNCYQYPFTCKNKSCQCRTQHNLCLRLQTSTIINTLSNKIISLQPLQVLINEKIDKIIDQLSDFRDQILLQIKQKFTLYGLTYNEQQVYKSLYSGQVNEMTGNKIWKACINTNNNKNDQFKSLINKIQNDINNFQKQSKQIYHKIKKQINLHSIKQNKSNQILNQIIKINYMIQNSLIINSKQQIQTLNTFFQPKKVASVQLLYRASQNQFSANKFHTNCDNKNHTLTLCLTEFDKKIGGYTSISWNTVKKSILKQDLKGDSFIFSLSNKDKFELLDKEKAIHHRNIIQGPNFGGGSDLVIADKSNKNRMSYANINSSYVNIKYKSNAENSMKKFIGGSGGNCYFKVKQWQVWQVRFEQNNNLQKNKKKPIIIEDIDVEHVPWCLNEGKENKGWWMDDDDILS